MATPPPPWLAQATEDGVSVLYLQGRWRLPHVAEIETEIDSLTLAGEKHCVIDGSRLENLDSAAGFLLLRHLAALAAAWRRSMCATCARATSAC